MVTKNNITYPSNQYTSSEIKKDKKSSQFPSKLPKAIPINQFYTGSILSTSHDYQRSSGKCRAASLYSNFYSLCNMLKQQLGAPAPNGAVFHRRWDCIFLNKKQNFILKKPLTMNQRFSFLRGSSSNRRNKRIQIQLILAFENYFLSRANSSVFTFIALDLIGQSNKRR